jgi:hypothetical protein
VENQSTRDEIVRQMSAIRTNLDGEVGGIVLNARRLVDWKYYVCNHPWLSLVATAAAGFLVVPWKTEQPAASMAVDRIDTASSNHKNRTVSPPAAAAATGGILGSVVSLATSYAGKMALQYASQHLKQLWMPSRSSSNTSMPPREPVSS